MRCDLGPKGWWCNRWDGHDGPCALWPRLLRHPLLWLEMHRR